MRLYDAHNHLQDDRFGGRHAELIVAAEAEGIARMVVNGACEEDWAQVQELAQKHVIVQPSFGYHPWYLHERTERWQSELVRFLDETPHAAVGEIGLDKWKPDLPYEGQEEVFVWQLRLAAERNLAASIHCLQSWGPIFQLLRKEPRPERGFLLHSYGGPAEMIRPLAKIGAYFSFPGYYLLDRKERQRETFKQVPLERLLVETDAPDQSLPEELNRHPLSDASTSKVINHPANLRAVYDGLAKVRGMAVEDLSEQVEENFKRLFGA
ncbi:MAG TPA: TatD family hydrolase [Verrucomicrobiae bacterium]